MEEKEKDKPEEFERYRNLWENGEITIREAAEELGLSSTTFYRWWNVTRS